ncbi:MAG TPA: geranylgeranyl reductase family protein [Saprospiraceae bacterium]|nr:geranylgeranyl reductase family protein [Saprospiraceae bacterium]
MNTAFDVIIVGAGPAGSACALALDGKGLNVALIDKATFPRDKVCGDAIPGQSFKAMRQIKPEWELQLRAMCEQTQIFSSRLYLSPQKSFCYQWISYAANSKRFYFDDFLFRLVKDQTNTKIFQNKQVNKLSIHRDSVTCILEDGAALSASIIAGCDGNHSVVKRSCLPPQKRDTVYAAVRAYYKGVSGITAGENEFHIIKEVDGYFWIFPLPDGYCNIGFGVINDKSKKSGSQKDIRQKLAQILASERFRARFENAQAEGEIKGFGLPLWTKDRRISGERFILAGDAASLVDPIQGHGIDKAIWSGVIAANQIQRCFQHDNFQSDFMTGYEDEINQKFGRELRRSYCLMKFLATNPFILKWLIYLTPPQRLINWAVKKLKI